MAAVVSVITVIPAKAGLTGASLALIHLLLGVVEKSQNKVKITVLTSSNALEYPAFRKLVQKGVSCKVLNIDRLPSPLYWLLLGLKLSLSGKHDIAHFSTPKVFFLMWPFANMVSPKKILTLEGFPPFELADEKFDARILGMFGWLFSLKKADVVTACSEWLKKIVEKSYNVRSKVVSIHNPVDVERFASGLVRGNGSLLYIGRLHKVKGVDTAVKALFILRRKHAQTTRLVVVGNGPELPHLRKLAEELNVEDSVEFVGHRTDVERYINQAEVVLVPSRYEPFGMTAAEAGAAGKPVVASAVGGLKEIIVDGVTGFLFERENVEMLAKKIHILLSDENLRRGMGENARKRIFENFSPTAVASKMIKLYVEAVKQ